MKKRSPSLSHLQRQYERWRRQLSKLGCISQGSVQDRTGRSGGGAGYQWTRKVAGKTVTVALTKDQFQEMKKAVDNRRKLKEILSRMERISRQIIFQSHPHLGRHKHLNSKVLGLN